MFGSINNSIRGLKISFFLNLNQSSEDLAIQLKNRLLEDLGLELDVIRNADYYKCFEHTMMDDIVILDATIEEKISDSIYHIFDRMHLLLEYVFIVSRSYLPSNFVPLREGGAKKYIDCEKYLDSSLENDRITNWVIKEISRLLENKNNDYPRKNKPDIMRVSEIFKSGLHGNLSEKVKLLSDYAPISKIENDIFISYRSKNEKEVSNLAEQLKMKGEKVVYFPSGELVYHNEILSTQNRWAIVFTIDLAIKKCKEMIIYETPDYFQSWWTQAEVVLRHRIIQEDRKITVFKDRNQIKKNSNYNYNNLIISERQKMVLELLFLISNFKIQDPQLIQAFQKVLHGSIFTRAKILSLLKLIINKVDFNNGFRIEAKGQIKKFYNKIINNLLINPWNLSYFRRVFHADFWDKLIIQCPLITFGFSIDNFILHQQAIYIPATYSELETGTVKCPRYCRQCQIPKEQKLSAEKCNGLFIISKKHPRYIWKSYLEYADVSSFLESVDVYLSTMSRKVL